MISVRIAKEEYMMKANTSFGDFLFQKRGELGISKKELAKELNVSERTITYWESCGGDNRAPSLTNLIALAEIFQISIDDMFF